MGRTARLSRDGIVETATRLAGEVGVDGVSMRRLATELGVDPMSLYHHVRDKEDLLAAMADAVVASIEPVTVGPWREALGATIMRARTAMLAHPWAKRVLESRDEPTPAGMRHVDAVLGILDRGGFDLAMQHHALHVLGSRILGFSQDLYDDAPRVRVAPEVAAAQAAIWRDAMPHLAALAVAADHDGALGGCDDDAEFAFALDLLLDGLEARRRHSRG